MRTNMGMGGMGMGGRMKPAAMQNEHNRLHSYGPMPRRAGMKGAQKRAGKGKKC